MAFSSLVFRRASASSILPLGIRSAAGVVPFSRFSSTSDPLVRAIESGCSSQRSSNKKLIRIPDEFPFEIEKKYIKCLNEITEDQKKYIFRRKCKDEIVEVEVDGYQVLHDKPYILMKANVLKGSQQLLFDLCAEHNQIDIYSCIMRDNVTGHLKALENYLAIRGFNSSTINFLFNCLWKKIPSYDIIRLIESNYCPQQSLNVPDEFPFEFEKGPEFVEGCKLFLKRHFEDEIIKAEVEVNLPWNGGHTFGITVEIVGGAKNITFLLNVFPHDPDPIHICEMNMSGHMEDFERFLEMRGIKPSATNFMLEYFIKKDDQYKL